MLQVKTPAIVLDKEPGYNNEGKILLFTKHFGIMRLTASGVYKPGASLAAWTEPPSQITVDIAIQEDSQGFGRLFTATLKNFFPHIHSSYLNMSWFCFYTYIVRNFLPLGVKSPKTFGLLKEVLKHTDSWKSAEGRDFNFAYFLVKLLKKEGICSGFTHCIVCGKYFDQNETVYFTLSEQGLLCRECTQKIAKNFYCPPENISLDFLRLLPQEKILNLPKGFLRVDPEERSVLETCEATKGIEQAYTNIFSRHKIDEHLFTKVRNFLLIFLAPLL